MAGFVKLSVQVPEAVRERLAGLGHGQNQLACTGALLWYFNADPETQRRYRSWAQAVADGEATIDSPTIEVKAIGEPRSGKRKSPAALKKRRKKTAKKKRA